ncbi:MAG TPA: HEAT repeat domain-containing protein [Terriglobales bacterium]|nr:HEAT repeat domain-containing protein [Terriglobales bacterium]
MRETRTGYSFYVAASRLAAVTLLLSVMSAAETRPSTPDVREQAWAVLTSGLRHHHASDRAAAVQALELMTRNRRAAQFAIRALSDKDFHVRAAAALSLGPMEAREAKPALHDALNDQEVSVALAATHSLYLLKDKQAYEIYYAILMGDRKSSNGLIQSQLDRLKDPKQMMQMGFEEGISFVPFGGMGYEAWRELHRHDGANARAIAAGFLAHDPDQITEDALIQAALADKNEGVRIAAVDALAERGDPKCIERLAKNLTEDKSAVRYRTAAAILHLGDVEKRPKK